MITKKFGGPNADYTNHTPSDTVPIKWNGEPVDEPCEGILVNLAGDVVTKNSLGQTAIHFGLIPGVIYPIRTHYIMETGTTATNTTVYFKIPDEIV